MIRDWYRAFRGFYPVDNPPRDFVSRFLFSARSIILVISAQAAMIGGLMALLDRRFNSLRFVLLLFALVSLHAVSNLSNDYFGYRRGHDTPDSPRRRYTLHPLADSVMTGRQILASLAVLLAIDLAIALLFVHWAGIWMLAYAVSGMAILILYDATPVSLKEIGLGEFASFIVWGPLMVSGGYFAITGHLSLPALIAGIPYGLGVMTVLLGKHIDQAAFDAAHGIHTLPVLLGERISRWLEIGLIFAMYCIIVVAVFTGILPWLTLLVFINIPRCWHAVRILASERPAAAPAGYVGWPLWYHRFSLQHNRSFGWLYIAGLLFAVVYYRLR
ncbi:MAG: prenyltransferase [Gammaproteobacteria bacterium]